MILIVDDDAVRHRVAGAAAEAGTATPVAGSVAGRGARLARDASACELVMQDMNFCRRTTGEEGLDLLERIRRGGAGAAGRS